MVGLAVTIPVTQELDKCGDEFLDDRVFAIEADISSNKEYVICIIDGKPHCYIKRSDLLALLRAMQLTIT